MIILTLRYDLIDHTKQNLGQSWSKLVKLGQERMLVTVAQVTKNLPEVHSNHIKNDSLLEHSFPAPLAYLLSHTLSFQTARVVTFYTAHN